MTRYIILSDYFAQSIRSSMPGSLHGCFARLMDDRMTVAQIMESLDIIETIVPITKPPGSHEITDLIKMKMKVMDNYDAYPKETFDLFTSMITVTDMDDDLAFKAYQMVHEMIDDDNTIAAMDVFAFGLDNDDVRDIIRLTDGLLIK